MVTDYVKDCRVVSTSVWNSPFRQIPFAGKVVGFSRDKTCVRVLRDNTSDPITVNPLFIEKEVKC